MFYFVLLITNIIIHSIINYQYNYTQYYYLPLLSDEELNEEWVSCAPVGSIVTELITLGRMGRAVLHTFLHNGHKYSFSKISKLILCLEERTVKNVIKLIILTNIVYYKIFSLSNTFGYKHLFLEEK